MILSEVWVGYALCLFPFLSIALAILDLLWFHINFWIVRSSSVKNIMGNLTGIAESIDCFWLRPFLQY